MVLVDSSIWIEHFKRPDQSLVKLLIEDLVLVHPSVIGEIACGSLRQRDEILGLLQLLPEAPVAKDDEVLQMISARKLYGRGIGWIDAQLLAAALLAGAKLMTLDRRLAKLATEMKLLS